MKKSKIAGIGFNVPDNIVKNHDIGAIKMEVSRNQKPKNNFLKKIRNLCYKKNIILMCKMWM